MDDKENKPSAPEKGAKNNTLGWKIAVVVLAIAVILLGIKAFWPSKDQEPKGDQESTKIA